MAQFFNDAVNGKLARFRNLQMVEGYGWSHIRSSKQKLQSRMIGGELYIYDQIGPDFFGGGLTALDVAEMLPQNRSEPLHVRVNSPGGDVYDGLTIFNMLHERENVTVQIDGIAASIASVIALAGDDVSIGQSGQYMIHNPYTFAMGDAEHFEEMASLLHQVKASLVEIYEKRSSLDAETIGQMMSDETYLTADQAVTHGFADRVMETRGKAKAQESQRIGANRAMAQARLDLMKARARVN